MSEKDKRARPRYEAPIVVALGEMARGAGTECIPGSSAVGYCYSGGTASGSGYCSTGTIADGYCTDGLAPNGYCTAGTGPA